VVRREFYAEVARIWRTPPAVFHTTGDASRREDRHGGSHKRVNTARLREEVAPQMRYPTYRHGLAAMANQAAN
jgi:predicted methyltransferase